MSDEIGSKEKADDGDKVAKDERNDTDTEKHGTEKLGTENTNTEVPKENKPRSVSFNRDVHVKRFGKPRESRGSSAEPSVRKEPFTHLSKQELIDEANKVRAQAENITCTADHPPEKFFSLPNRRKYKEKEDRRNSEDGGTAEKSKSALGRSSSDVGRKRERTSLSTLYRRAQKAKNPPSIVVTSPTPSKPVIVKRSKSDVSDLKSNTNLNPLSKPIRKRSGSETEEFLKSLRNKKTQLSPIIESSPREDYFKKTSPLELLQKQKLAQQDSIKSDDQSQNLNISTDSKKVNPVLKPPRYKAPETVEPKPPKRTKRGKSQDKEKSPPIADTPKRKTDLKKTLLVDEIDSIKAKDINPVEIKDRIKDSIRKLEQNVYGDKEMIHSSQQPPDKPPLTRGHTVNHIVRILKEDQQSPSPKVHLIAPNSINTNVNQPFSYIKPSVSPDPNLFIRNTSPDRVPTPVNTMANKGVVYAHVVRDHGDTGSNLGKQTVHKTYSPSREKAYFSDEDEGLGYEERHKYSANKFDYNYKNDEHDNFSSLEGPKIKDSPIRPRFREYKLTSFDDFEPTYANEYPSAKDKSHDYIDSFRGRADGMDTKKKSFETENKMDLDFNELSHRRQLLESRLNARRFDTRREINPGEPVSRYLAETDPIYEAQKRMKATEKYVNETAKYIHRTLERDGLAESSATEEYNRYDSDNHKVKYNTESRTFSKVPKGELDRREFIDRLEPRYKDGKKHFPPEPEYEPPSLEFNTGKPVLSPDEYTEKKYKVKKNITSSHDVVQTGKKYNGSNWFGQRKGHYASNPEIAQERDDDYANIRHNAKNAEAYHNSLRRVKNKDRYKEDYGIRRHDSGDSRDYYRDDRSPRRFEIDNRLVDSGIENDFRKDSGEIHNRFRRHESDDDVRNTSLFLASERQHTEDNYPSEQIYVNGEYIARFKDYTDNGYRKEYARERRPDEGSHLDPKRYDKSPTDDKVSAKPPKATKKLSGLEKVKQLFSRDSSKKSKKREEKEPQPKTRTRVLKSPEHLVRDDSEYRRYTDPEPSDTEIVKKKTYKLGEYCEDRRLHSSREHPERRTSPRDDDRQRSSAEESDRQRSREDLSRNRHMSPRDKFDRERSSRENLDRQRSSREDVRYRASKDDLRHKSPDPRDSDGERKYRETDFDERFQRTKEDRWYKERKEERRYNSSDRESELRASDAEHDRRKTRSRTAGPIDSPALAERYRERRRLATPSPTPSPPPRPAQTSAGNWFKSLDRLARKKTKPKGTKIEKESVLTTEDESTRKTWSKTSKPLNSPAKNLRFFGDTDQDSDANVKPSVTKSRSHPQTKSHSTLRKTVSNSSTGLDEVDHEITNKSYSLSNLKDKSESPRTKQYYKRNLQNISEIHSNSEAESQLDRRALKPPISPYDRSRSHSSSKTLKGSKADIRRHKNAERGSSSELTSSKQDLRDFKHRRRTPATNSGESSTEGDSSHQSQRSVVFLHATTVGDIPDPGHLSRNRSRDDVSSVNSSNLQVESTTKSFSIFAPWTPRHYNDQHDVHYSQRVRKSKSREPTFKKSSSTKNLSEDRPSLQKNKSYSQTTLTRKPQNNRLTSSSTTLYRKPEKRRENSSAQGTTLRKSVAREKKSQSSEILNRDSDRERLSRSISMPKDSNKKAGWFKLTNKTKKQENTRVR